MFRPDGNKVNLVFGKAINEAVLISQFMMRTKNQTAVAKSLYDSFVRSDILSEFQFDVGVPSTADIDQKLENVQSPYHLLMAPF